MVAPNGFNLDRQSSFNSGDRITPEGKEALLDKRLSALPIDRTLALDLAELLQ